MVISSFTLTLAPNDMSPCPTLARSHAESFLFDDDDDAAIPFVWVTLLDNLAVLRYISPLL